VPGEAWIEPVLGAERLAELAVETVEQVVVVVVPRNAEDRPAPFRVHLAERGQVVERPLERELEALGERLIVGDMVGRVTPDEQEGTARQAPWSRSARLEGNRIAGSQRRGREQLGIGEIRD